LQLEAMGYIHIRNHDQNVNRVLLRRRQSCVRNHLQKLSFFDINAKDIKRQLMADEGGKEISHPIANTIFTQHAKETKITENSKEKKS
jgi:hypothetical protein